MEFLGRGYQNKRTTPLPRDGGRNFSHGRADRHGCREIHCTPPRETRASFRFWEGDDSSFAPAHSEVEGVPQVQQEQSRLDPLRNRGLRRPTLEASRCPLDIPDSYRKPHAPSRLQALDSEFRSSARPRTYTDNHSCATIRYIKLEVGTKKTGASIC